jgi:hypothetical protein
MGGVGVVFEVLRSFETKFIARLKEIEGNSTEKVVRIFESSMFALEFLWV